MTSMKKLIWSAGLGVVICGITAAYRPDLAVRVATGVVAHDLCSKTFTSSLDPGAIMAETVTRPGIRRLKWVLTHNIDQANRTVVASVVGLMSSRAVFRDGLGCTLVHDVAAPRAINIDIGRLKSGSEPLLPPIAGPALVQTLDVNLKAALDHAFEEPPAPPLRRTKAIVVVRDGRVIAERYATGVSINTPLMGFSMTKSVTNALLGILVRQGRLTPSQPAPVPEWRTLVGDPRQAITIEQLMRMSSGLDLDETNTGFDPSSRMVYLHDDTAAMAARAKLITAPGARWAYSSPSTILLSRVIGDALGGRPEQTLAFAWRELFGPLGMQTVTLEFDASGTWHGNSYMFASARDWAKFGLLYLTDGVVGGRRILPEGWVDVSASSTLDGPYGAGFWTLRSAHPWSKRWAELGFPTEAFFASGDLGQRIAILPSQNLVIVRLGDAVGPTNDMPGFARLVREVVTATQVRP